MSNRRGIPRFFWYAAGIVLLYFVLAKMNILPSLRELFTAKEVKIDSTPILIKEVKEIAQLMTVANYDEVVIDSSKNTEINTPDFLNKNLNLHLEKGNDIVIIAHGKIICGIDLNELEEKKMYIKDDSVSIKMPKAKILEAIVNPSDLEIFYEKGKWSTDEVNTLKVAARQRMMDRSIAMGILQKAEVKSVAIMQNFLKSAGFKKINVY
jgi:hypothetical protein